jgi:hypothetical protein
MTNQNKTTPSNFWFGFAIGTASAVGIGYLLGTKKGRSVLKSVIEYAEELGEDPEQFMELLNTVLDSASKSTPDTGDTNPIQQTFTSLGSVLERVKNLQEERQKKRFFSKNDE